MNYGLFMIELYRNIIGEGMGDLRFPFNRSKRDDRSKISVMRLLRITHISRAFFPCDIGTV